MLFFAPSPALLMPVFATKVLGLGPAGLGLLFSALGSGTIAGSVLTAWLSDYKRKVPLIAAAYAVWCGALGAFAFCTGLYPAMGALAVVGAAQNGLSATSITLMQQRVLPQMRGRVMSLNTVLLMGIRPLGDYPVSAAICSNRRPESNRAGRLRDRAKLPLQLPSVQIEIGRACRFDLTQLGALRLDHH